MGRTITDRRLVTILVADVVSYSRLIGADETGTLRRLKALRRDVIDPSVTSVHGRIIKTMGGGFIAEFASAVRAVSCAVTIQQGLARHEAEIPDDRALRLRIGINLGDVVVEPDGDLYGDGVNVAARLEPLAEPGGICIARSVYDQVRDNLRYPFQDRGELELKNIARPVGVYFLSASAIVGLAGTDEQAPEPVKTSNRKPWKATAVGAGFLTLLAAGGLGWWSWTASKAPAPNQTIAAKLAGETREAPRLSIVVLPFSNLSNDPEQDYFADSITEDLTTDLSHLAGSFVIARNTAFTYKNKPVGVKQIGQELGVRYVLEGSVRRSGERVVVSAELISAETGAQIWFDRFDGDQSRLGDLQVEFVARLARSLDVQLTEAESLRSLRERPVNPDASDLAMRGWASLNKQRSIANNNEAIRYFEQALKLDPTLPRATLGLSRALMNKVLNRWSDDIQSDTRSADELVNRYLEKFPHDAAALVVKGDVFRADKYFDAAIAMYDAAISDNDDFAAAYAAKGQASTLSGKAYAAIPNVLQAIRISPRDPLVNVWYYFVCHAHMHMAQWEEAISWCNRSVAVSPYWLPYIDLAAAYAWVGHDQEAKAAVSELLKLTPGYTVKKWANAGWSNNPKFLEEYKLIVDGLRKAGLQEE
ncbi:adenylate/guanylate cyclase domain-containing protein [Methylobacterium nodulans]|uniref:Adenylate/guanylate cyclase n=1 Tax=Methylobacterium nodulans (strain LMG 21967 / CNCM I-2342 / ORS 2060) TaxID=460265 RepID=B8IU99_METNO|nr:adenylate/guanylate cyclase domain-containing protein [Methylobacterium nodulans]ACL55144.1 adenylate/guanylate cyclase [Methylobacterium nodulans ORS 2060]